MKRWLRRLKGAIGTALTWAVSWSVTGMLLGTTGFLGQLALVEYVVFGGAFAALGFIGGATFSVVLSLTEGRRRFDQLSLPRFALWGAFGGALMSLTMAAFGESAAFVNTVTFFAVLGAGSSAGSLVLARKAEDQELLRSADQVAEVGLSGGETRELLGE